MQNYICMLCKKGDLDLANIYLKNGRNNSARDDILDLYGDIIEQHLKSDDLICVNCIQVLDNVVRLKQQVYEIIVDHAVSKEILGKPGTKVFNLSKAWNLRISTALPSYSSYDGCTDAASPSDLLMITGSIPYDQRSDTDMEIANSKYRSYDSDSTLDREIQDMTGHRRRIRGHKWSRRKSSQRVRDRSRATSSRSNSRTSRMTTSSRLSRATTNSKRLQIQKHFKDSQMQRILGDFLYQNDSLSRFARAYIGGYVDTIDISDDVSGGDWGKTDNGKPIAKTRFASEIRDRLISEYQRIVYECPENSCNETFYNLEAITEHRVKKHNEMALFWCEQCKFSYLSQEHLDKHKETHYGTFMQYCIYCSEEYTNKKLYEEHLNEHLIHSFPCIYCDKFFLRKQLCEKHIREQHPGRKRKIKRIKPQSILDRIDKNPENSELGSPHLKNNRKDSEQFVVRILRQNGRAEDSNVATEEDLEDGTCEDLNFEEEITTAQENELEMISSNN